MLFVVWRKIENQRETTQLLAGNGCQESVTLRWCCCVVFSFQPESYSYQKDQGRYLNQGSHYSGKGLSAVEPEYGDSYCNRQFKIVASGGEGNGYILIVRCANSFTEEEANEEHNGKIQQKRNGYAKYIAWNLDNYLTKMVKSSAMSVNGAMAGMNFCVYQLSPFSFTNETLVNNPARNGIPR